MRSCLKIKAFTLIELLVSISVLALVASISVSSYPKFSEQIGLSTQAARIVAYVREAQVYGSAGYTEPGVKVVYGVEIDKVSNILKRVQWTNPNSNTNSSYANTDNLEDTTEPNLELNTRYEIDMICSVLANVSSCNSNQNYDNLLMLFRRPNPEARLIGRLGSNLYPAPSDTNGFQRVEFFIRSKKNEALIKKIVILQTGQIYVE